MFEDQKTAKAAPPVDLPESGQEAVKPKLGREAPGTEDIFSNTEAGPEAGPTMPSLNALNNQPETGHPGLKEAPKTAPKPAAPAPPEPLSELPDDLEEEGGSKKFFWIGLIVLIIILGSGGYFAYGKFFAPAGQNLPLMNFVNSFLPTSNEEFEAELDEIKSKDRAEEKEPDEVEGQILQEEDIIDELEDQAELDEVEYVEQEADLDSDGDGLTDAEELLYGTDSTESDTDGDNLFDFEEVKVYSTDPLDPDTDEDGYTDGSEVQGGYDPNGPGKLLDLNFEE